METNMDLPDVFHVPQQEVLPCPLGVKLFVWNLAFWRADDQLPILPRDAFIDGQRAVLNVQVLPSQG